MNNEAKFWRLVSAYLTSKTALAIAFFMTAFFLSLFNIFSATYCGPETGCVAPYWANFWLISYTDGYERRAFFGQVVRFFFDGSISYIVMNAIALIIAICILLSTYLIYFLKTSNNRSWLIVFFVLVSGPATTVFFEVLGDPLHIAFACVIAYILFAKKLASVYLSGATALLTGLLVVLIHEASIFLFLPVIYLFYKLSVEKEPKYLPLASIMILLTLGVVVLLNAQNPTSTGMSLVTKTTVYFPPKDILPSFFTLLKSELLHYFGSAKGPFYLAYKIVGVFLWPVLVLQAIGHIQKAKACFSIFVFLLLPSLPLYVIAADWGRFAIYTLCLSLIVYGKISDNQVIALPHYIYNISEKCFQLTRPMFGRAASIIVLLLLFYSRTGYRVDGLSEHTVIIVFVSIVAFMLNDRFNLEAEKRKGSQSVTSRQDEPN